MVGESRGSQSDAMSTGQSYDTIAERYRDSKRLPFRRAIKRYTVFPLLGDLRGQTVLDLPCGEGSYARQFMREGAAAVTGVDISKQMIALAETAEQADQIGCRYVCEDAARFIPGTPVDVVTAFYLLNYARNRDELAAFCRSCFRALRPGGRLVGFNDNVRRPPRPGVSLAKYGLERTCRYPLHEGDGIRYRITNPDGQVFEVATYDSAMRDSGFGEFRWIDAALDPSERQDPIWDEFLAQLL